MIILPDKNIARAKFLLPMHRRDWHSPARNIVFQTWIAQAFRADHSMVWQGHFEDREDADEFMFALVTGKLKQDGYLRRLPIYCPDFDPAMLDDPGIAYNLVTNIGIGPSSGNWSAPSDCHGFRSRAGEFIDCIGAGGGGGAGGPFIKSTGGGGGGFARRIQLILTPAQAVAFEVGSGGAGGVATPTQAVGAGGTAHTYFYSPANPGVRALVGGGGTAVTGTGASSGGAGGGADAGDFGYTGGRGGNTAAASYSSVVTGGGAAAQPGGNGNNGGDTSGPAGAQTAGGASAGLIYGPWGPGSGGGGTAGGNGVVGAPGDHYGGGGGAAMNTGSTAFYQYGGAGGAGLIVLRYEPRTSPVVSSIAPTSGPTGGAQSVTITGSNFVAISSANIGGSPITGLSVPNTTTITGTTSAGAAGLYNVNVYVSDGPGPGTGVNKYTHVTPPSVSSCSPNVGPTVGGTPVTLTGANMAGVSSVTIGGVAATSVVAVNATTVTCVTPAHASGLVNITVTNTYGTGTGNSLFTYGVIPSVSGCAPPLGLTLGNTAVTISGANFTGASGVTFGGTPATSVVVVNDSTITCRTPAHAKGLVSVNVTTSYGTSPTSNVFTYLLPASGFNMPMMGI